MGWEILDVSSVIWFERIAENYAEIVLGLALLLLIFVNLL
jgi:hypothetical protein